MSMLKYFFDIRNSDENKKLFENLYISKNPFFEFQAQYPVVFISFKEFEKFDWQSGFKILKEMIGNLYEEYEFLSDELRGRRKNKFDEILYESKDANWELSLKNLTKYLYEYYGKKVIILIDEYDTPIIKAHLNGYYKEAVAFFKSFFEAALKDNEYLEFGVMTGILRIAKEGIFSGLNHVEMNTFLTEEYSEYFGITEEEMEIATKYYNETDKIEEIREWYNGYLFGNTKIYNPWSLINFYPKGELKAHWINTSSNDLIINYLRKAGTCVYDDLEKLFKGESIEKMILETMDFNELENDIENGIWQLFLYSGYLTVEKKGKGKKKYFLKILNKEIYEFFSEAFIYTILKRNNNLFLATDFLEEGNFEKFGKELGKTLTNTASYYDYSGNEKEQFYHGLAIGILSSLHEKYIIQSNRESGLGRYDLVLEPRKNKQDINLDNKGFILEFKVVKNENELEAGVKEAMRQIEEKKYETDLIDRGVKKIAKIGIAFFDNLMKMEVLKNF